MSLSFIGIKAALIHFFFSFAVLAMAGTLVFLIWYPSPYQELAGGGELFLLMMVVDVICGPLLTLVLFNPAKSRFELCCDLTLIAIIQLAALGYGLETVWQARPLFLVLEIDRFKVLGLPDFPKKLVFDLDYDLKPSFFSGPVVVAVRAPKDEQERQTVLLESLQGGRDYAERPEFYVAYEGVARLKALDRAKPLSVFLQKYSDQRVIAAKLAVKESADAGQWMYLPIVARQDWVAVINQQGKIQGFLKGDGF